MPRPDGLDPQRHGRHTGRVTRHPAGAIPVALIAAAGGLVRVAGVVLRRPWHDEYFTAWVTSLPWRELVPALAQDSGPPLPYVLAKLLASCGVGELAAARTLPVVVGTLAILVVARAAATTAGTHAAAWAAAVLAFHPLALAWSCEGRAYAYLLLGAALVWDGMAALVAQQRGAGKLALGATLALWSHGLGVILLAVTLPAALLVPTAMRRRLLTAAGAATLAFLAWLPVMLQQPPASVAWMQRAWQALPDGRAAVAAVELLVPAGRFGHALDLPSAPLLATVASLAAALVLIATALAALRRRALLALYLAAAPALALSILAALALPVFYPGRGEALYLAPVIGLLACGAARGGAAPPLAALLVAAGVVMSGLALAGWRSTPPRAEEHLATAVRSYLPEGATVLIEGYWRLGLWYHLGEHRSRFDVHIFPPAADAHPGWYEGGGTTEEAEAARRQLVRGIERGNEVACILPPPQVNSALRAAAAAAGLTPVARTAAWDLWIRRGSIR